MKIQGLIISVFITAVSFSGCRKSEVKHGTDTYVRLFQSDSDFASLGIAVLDDGNYILTGYEYRYEWPIRRNPARVIKFDADGKPLWDKRIPRSGSTICKVLPVAGKGFLTLGITDFDADYMALCLYDYSGQLLSEHKVYINGKNRHMSPVDMISLSGGGYAIAGQNRIRETGILTVLHPGFDSVFLREFSPLPDYHQVTIRSLCEMPDGNIAMAANSIQYNPFWDTAWMMPSIITVSKSGVLQSHVVHADSAHWQSPYAILPFGDDLLMSAVSYAADWQNGDGCEVNYDFSYSVYGLGSGRIQFNVYDKTGLFKRRKTVSGYPKNGMIRSMRRTTDGGFICCGTVNQANSYYLLSDTKMLLLKLDAGLNVQWSKTVPVAYQSFGTDALQTPDGGYLVSGFTRSADSKFQQLIIKTDKNGAF